MHAPAPKRQRVAAPDVPLPPPSAAVEARVIDFDKKINANAGKAVAAFSQLPILYSFT